MLTQGTYPLWARRSAALDHRHVVVGHWAASEEAIRLRAYFISLETGGHDPLADWLRAEAEYRAEAGRRAAGAATPVASGSVLLEDWPTFTGR